MRLLVAVAIAAALAVAAAGIAIALHGNDRAHAAVGAGTDQPSTRAQVMRLFAPVAAAQSQLQLAEQSVSSRGARLTVVRLRARAVTSAVTAAEQRLAALQGESVAGRQLLAAAESALQAHAAYAQDLAGLPPRPSALGSAAARQLRSDAASAEQAYATLRVRVSVGTAAVVGGDVAPLLAAATAAHTRAARRSALRGFVVKVETFLEQSSNGRAEIASAISATDGGCSIDPYDASQQVSSVAANRQSLLDQLSAMTPPSAPRAQRVYSLLHEALEHSIEADRHFSDWMVYVSDYYYTPPYGCYGQPPHNADYEQAMSESALATSAKQQLVSAFDPLAASVGLRSDWTEADI